MSKRVSYSPLEGQHSWYPIYEIVGCALAFCAFVLALINFADLGYRGTYVASAVVYVYFLLDFAFALFFCRSWAERKQYIRAHAWELVALIPADVFVSDPDVKHLLQLLRSIAYLMRLMNRARNFFDTCGFKYAIALFMMLIAMGTWGFSMHEGYSMANSGWWAITTVATVGYGDIVPVTPVGKLIGIGLMLVGVVFIGLITSTITTFITRGQIKHEARRKAQHRKHRRLAEADAAAAASAGAGDADASLDPENTQQMRTRILQGIKADIDRLDELSDADIVDMAKVLRSLRAPKDSL